MTSASLHSASSGVLAILFSRPMDTISNSTPVSSLPLGLWVVKCWLICRSGLSEADVLRAIERRAAARKEKDFAAADAVREEIAAKGIQILDTPEGTVWRPNPNLEIAAQ